jgi:hypothetical protein
MTRPSLLHRAVAEGLGTAFLLATVLGSGIMGDKLAGGYVALLANTIATGAGLTALILTFGPISGAHFNPRRTDARFDRARRKYGPTSSRGWFVTRVWKVERFDDLRKPYAVLAKTRGSDGWRPQRESNHRPTY